MKIKKEMHLVKPRNTISHYVVEICLDGMKDWHKAGYQTMSQAEALTMAQEMIDRHGEGSQVRVVAVLGVVARNFGSGLLPTK